MSTVHILHRMCTVDNKDPRGEGGAVRHQRGESHRRWLIDVMLFMPYDIESQSRNADFISIA